MNKIVFFLGTLSAGGAERVISILSERLSKYKEVEIILYYDRPIFYKIDSKVKITVLDREAKSKKSILNKAIWLRRYLKDSPDTLIVSFLAPLNMFLIASLLGIKKNLIVAERNDPRHIPNNNLLRIVRNILYLFVDGIIVQTENNKKYFNRLLQKKIRVIYNPVVLSNEYVRDNNNIQKTIVSVGRLIPQKNQIMLIEAFRRIYDIYPDHKLIIYGEGEMRSYLEEKIKYYNLEQAILLPGTTQDVFANIVNCKAFVLTSEFEGMPNALIEAMCLGVPSISTKVSGAIDLIKDGYNGILVEQNSVDDLADAIKSVISDPSLSERLSRNSRKLLKELDVDRIVQEWNEAFSLYTD